MNKYSETQCKFIREFFKDMDAAELQLKLENVALTIERLEKENEQLKAVSELPLYLDLCRDLYHTLAQAYMTGAAFDEDTKQKIINVLARYEQR